MDQRTRMESEMQKWQQSGLSQREFCQHSGIKFSTFCYWRNKINKEKPQGFLPLFPPVSSETLKLIYPNGVRVKVNASDLKTISQLISLY